MQKILLIQIWMGKIPNYFWYHYDTTKNLQNIDFLFITDQKNFSLDSKNYRIIYKDINDIQNLIRNKSGFENITITNNKKICDLKASLGHMFEEYTLGYDYFGFYDIDTLFGDLSTLNSEISNNYDAISFGDSTYHNRIAGPFTILKNTKEIREFYINEDFHNSFMSENVVFYEENVFFERFRKQFNIKIIFDQNNIDIKKGGKIIYECLWDNGSLYCNEKEIALFHFYRKSKTNFIRIGDKIRTYQNKELIDDFYWVVHFSENYEKYLPHLMRSIKKYSNRKCIFYSINYFPKVGLEYQTNQFIFKRIDIPKGEVDEMGKDFNIMTSKPKILLDAIKTFPDKKFVHIDTDIYLTTNSDDISNHFKNLENYPLANSHVHDVIFVRNVKPEEEWTSSLHVLLDAEKIENEPIFPRRKCNIILFDKRSKWFFEEQMGLYEKYRNSNIPGILSIYDEDTFNALLAKYELPKSLPLVDIEESYNLSTEKIFNYSYSIITKNLSPKLVAPTTLNEFLFFHGFKNVEDYLKIENDYDKSVISSDEFFIYHSKDKIFFEKNSFLTDKKNLGFVNFIIKNNKKEILHRLDNQDINAFWIFYLIDIQLNKGTYLIEIYKKEDGHKVYSDFIKIT